VAWAKAYLRTKWHLDPFSRLATTDMGRKLEAVSLFGEGGDGPHLTQCGLGQGLYFYTKLYLDPSSRLATTDMDQKWGVDGGAAVHL